MSPDEFEDVVAGEFEEEIDTASMNPLELSAAYSKLRIELLDLGEMLEATTDRGRALHIRRATLIFALREQGLMG